MAKEKAYEETCAQLVLIDEGTYHYHLEKELMIACPISIHGAGQDRTILQGYGFEIKGTYFQGTKEEGKRVDMQGMTMKGSSDHGLFNENGLSFVCKDMTFTQCGGYSGVYAQNTKGRLINCVITQCKWSGIECGKNALIEVEGDQTKVDGNVTRGNGYGYGLKTYSTSSIIHLLFPLTQESVSTNNHGGRNYRSGGTIETVDSFA